MITRLNQNTQTFSRNDHKQWQAKNERHNDRYEREDRNQTSQDSNRLRDFAKGQNRTPKNEAPHQMGNEMFRDFPNREGYQANFLGVNLPLPTLDPELEAKAATLKDDPSSHELKYTHFSVIQHKERRTPLLTAVNVDGSQYVEHERDGKWVFDSRIDRKYQLGNEVYSNNSIDKGHMVRRRDPMWGPDGEKGQDDTFVYTNASLQHSELNQKNWLDLENHVLNGAINDHKKITVFTGPVLLEDDPKFDNKGKVDPPTQMPRAFYKVAVEPDGKGGLQGAAYVMHQDDLIGKEGNGGQNHVELTNFDQFRVTIKQLEDLTHINFGDIHDAPQGT
ncbi:MAG: DNA/RNA non-specific endonuclease [Candidatus Eremiobacteraeota bacterium]|nr:DNA/RNA non-specific endonuclease [Candidatus Eremiobacteraeota bacterium]